MFFYHEGDTFYLKAWEYNTTLVLEKLATLVEAHNGKVKSANKGFIEYQREDREGSRREVSHLGYMSFILDGYLYYIQFDENPFFDHFYTKSLIKDGKVAKNHYLDKLEDRVRLDEKLMHYNCDEAIIENIAQAIFEALTEAPASRLVSETKREKVHNSYDGGYHWETVKKAPLYEAVGF